MGLLDGLMGNASKIAIDDVRDEFASVLANNEQLTQAYKLVRDLLVFTNKRIIFAQPLSLELKSKLAPSVQQALATNLFA